MDILEFRIPVDSNKTVFVWEIPPVLTQDQVYVSQPELRPETGSGSGSDSGNPNGSSCY